MVDIVYFPCVCPPLLNGVGMRRGSGGQIDESGRRAIWRHRKGQLSSSFCSPPVIPRRLDLDRRDPARDDGYSPLVLPAKVCRFYANRHAKGVE